MKLHEKRKSLSFIAKVSRRLIEEAPNELMIEDIRRILDICAEAIEKMEQSGNESDKSVIADVAIGEIRDIMHSVDDEKSGFGKYSIFYALSVFSIRAELEKIPEQWEVIMEKCNGAMLQKGIR